MNSVSTTTKCISFTCLSGIALLGIASATNVSTTQDSARPQVIELRLGEAQDSGVDAASVDPLDLGSTHLVSDTQDFSFYFGIQSDDPKTRKLKADLSYAEKKSAAYMMLRDAELQRAELATEAPQKLEAKAKAKLHEAEAERLESEIRELKTKLSSEPIGIDQSSLGEHTSFDPAPCCRDNNLAYGRTVTASSQEEIINNLAQLAVDGDLSTRWCADDEMAGEWIQVDLGAPKDVTKIRLHWEMMQSKYSYKIETSTDGQTWTQSVDTSDNPRAEHMPEHDLNAKGTRFIRVTFLGNDDGFWGSLREIEVTDGELSERPEEAWEKVRGDATGFRFGDVKLLFDA